MKKVESKKEWTTKSGHHVEVIGTLKLEKEVYADGHSGTVEDCEIFMDVRLDGRSQGSWVQELSAAQKANLPDSHKDIVARVGKVGLTQEQVEIIDSVRAELEQHPAWQAEQSRIAQNQKEIAELDLELNGVVGFNRGTY